MEPGFSVSVYNFVLSIECSATANQKAWVFWTKLIRSKLNNGSEHVYRANAVTNCGFHFNQSSRLFVLTKQITYCTHGNEMGALELNLSTSVHPFKLTVSLCFSNLFKSIKVVQISYLNDQRPIPVFRR